MLLPDWADWSDWANWMIRGATSGGKGFIYGQIEIDIIKSTFITITKMKELFISATKASALEGSLEKAIRARAHQVQLDMKDPKLRKKKQMLKLMKNADFDRDSYPSLNTDSCPLNKLISLLRLKIVRFDKKLCSQRVSLLE